MVDILILSLCLVAFFSFEARQVSSFSNSMNPSKLRQSYLKAKISPNRGESMDDYRKVIYNLYNFITVRS